MKKFCTLLFLFAVMASLPASAQARKRKDSTTVTIQLNNFRNKNAAVDSVVVIFDKHNRTGAGTVRQLFVPVNNEIVIPNVPEGKYYIDIYCLGIYQQYFREISYVYNGRKNRNRFRFSLGPAEAFNRSTVYIPKENIDPARLSIFRARP